MVQRVGRPQPRRPRAGHGATSTGTQSQTSAKASAASAIDHGAVGCQPPVRFPTSPWRARSPGRPRPGLHCRPAASTRAPRAGSCDSLTQRRARRRPASGAPPARSRPPTRDEPRQLLCERRQVGGGVDHAGRTLAPVPGGVRAPPGRSAPLAARGCSASSGRGGVPPRLGQVHDADRDHARTRDQHQLVASATCCGDENRKWTITNIIGRNTPCGSASGATWTADALAAVHDHVAVAVEAPAARSDWTVLAACFRCRRWPVRGLCGGPASTGSGSTTVVSTGPT